FPVLRKKIAALTHRSDNIHLFACGWREDLCVVLSHLGRDGARLSKPLDRDNFMVAPVKRRTDEIVHSRVDNGEFFLRRFFDVTNTSQQDSRVPHQQTTGLEQNSQPKSR